MDWSNLRGKAINNPPPIKRDLDLVQYKIVVVINKELDNYKTKVKIKENKYGKWIIK